MRVYRASLLVCLLSTLTFAAVPDRVTQAIDASQTVQLARSVHPKAQAQYDQGVVDPQLQLGYVTLLTSPSPSQQRALDRLLAEQQDPSSPNYHQWLTPEQYADRFGLSQNDVTRITAWLKAQGFTVLGVARGRNFVTFSGTAAQISAALHTEIHSYTVNGEMHAANASLVSIPAALAGTVVGFRGLNDFRLKPMSVRKRMQPEYYDSSLKFTFLAPGDIKTIYDLEPLYTAGIDGTGQTLAVAGQTDIYLADLADFRSGFGLSAIAGCTTNSKGVITACNSNNFRYVVVGSDPGAPSAGDLEESDLDLEWSGAVARNAQIIFVTAPATANGVFDALYYAIDNILAPVVSLSYGTCELGEIGFFSADETELQKANSEGITVINSSGDTSAAGCDGFTNNTTPPNLATGGLAVGYPASSPEVTGVGGTAIPFADTGSPFWGTTNGSDGGSLLPPPPQLPEQSWNDPAEFGQYCSTPPSSGGGAGGLFCTSLNITSALTAQEALGLGGGGGGASNCIAVNGSGACTGGFPQPAWQTVTITGQNTRMVPDISLLASPNFTGYIYCTPLSELGGTGSTSSCASGIANALAGCAGGGTCSVVGGTSASTPVFAGMVALLNQYFQGTLPNGLGNINPMLYKLAKTPSNTAFHQLTSASSSNNNVVYCAGGTPSNQPAALRCPGATGTVATIGYQASNFDASTGYNLVTGLGSIDLNQLALLWAANRAASTTALAASASQVVLGQSVTLTATVTPSTAVGTVSFYNNGSATALGTAAVSGGVAAFSTSSLTVGANSITATYNGDANNDTSTSNSVTVTAVVPTFTWSNIGTASHTVLAGQQTLAYSLKATPTSSANFEGTVTFSCSFAPTDPTLTNSSCVFTPASIAAGSAATTVTLQIATKGPNTGTGAAIQHRADKRSPWLPLALPIAGVVMAGLAGRKVWKHSARAGLCVALVLLGLLIACGGGSNPVAVTVTPASASLYPNNTGWPSQTASFSANVSNTSNTAVTWTASSGSIDASGNYTAPTMAAGLPSSATITAASQADSSKTGTAIVTLKPTTLPNTYGVTVTATEGPTSHAQAVTLIVQ